MKLTFFESSSKSKMPVSPFNDLTFDFKTVDVNRLEDMYRIMVKNFVLNLPLSKDIRTYRRKSSLKDYLSSEYTYIILDINDIKTKEKQVKILKYFKSFNCIIGESPSNNNIDNFNIKGILCIKTLNNLNNVKILVDQIKDDLREYGTLDTSVSNVGSVTAPINRYNILLQSNGKPYEYVYRHIEKQQYDVNVDTNVKTLSELCLNVFTSMGFKAVKTNGKCINFEHENEDYKGGYYWYSDSPFIMHHCNECNTINIYDAVSKTDEFKEFYSKNLNYEKLLCSLELNTRIHRINSRYIQIDEDISSMIEQFLNTRESLFVIKSPMGTGKSTLIEKIIEEAKELDMRILICTNRISVANDSLTKYKLKIYNQNRYKSNDSIIVQYDSLHHYDIKKFDLVIFDEFISLLLHARNNLNNILKNMLNFFACFKKKLVIADAFLTGYENLFVDDKKMSFVVENEYRDDTVIYNYADFNFFIRSIGIHAKKHKLTISCTSTKVLYALRDMLAQNGLKVHCLTSETPKIMKEIIYEKFKNRETFCDVLLYSPTLTVGVSILCNFDMHFHYDCSNSCDVISALQMIKRNRNASEIHIYVKNRTNYLKTTYNEVKDEYIQNVGTQYNCFFEYNEYAEMRLSNLGKRSIQIDVFRNILEYNHKNAFFYLLRYQFKNKPTIVSDKFDDNILLPYIRKIDKDNSEYLKECLNEYFNINNVEINSDTFDVLYEMNTMIKSDVSSNIRHEILSIGLKDKSFFTKIKRLKIIKKYENRKIDKKYIQNLISQSLTNNVDDVIYWNSYLNFESKLENVYNIKTIQNNSKLKSILEGCGYIKTNRNGLNVYTIDENIVKYGKLIKDE